MVTKGSAVPQLQAEKRPSGRSMDLAVRWVPALLDNTEIDKWDWVLDNELAAEATAARLLDVDGAWDIFERIAGTDSHGL